MERHTHTHTHTHSCLYLLQKEQVNLLALLEVLDDAASVSIRNRNLQQRCILRSSPGCLEASHANAFRPHTLVAQGLKALWP
jgi:hypothetical protein